MVIFISYPVSTLDTYISALDSRISRRYGNLGLIWASRADTGYDKKSRGVGTDQGQNTAKGPTDKYPMPLKSNIFNIMIFTITA